MSMALQQLIDREDILLDSQKLEDLHSNKRLLEKIDEVRDRFIEDNIGTYDFNTISLLYRLTKEIKEVI